MGVGVMMCMCVCFQNRKVQFLTGINNGFGGFNNAVWTAPIASG